MFIVFITNPYVCLLFCCLSFGIVLMVFSPTYIPVHFYTSLFTCREFETPMMDDVSLYQKLFCNLVNFLVKETILFMY